jgi:hypothetical protein
MALMPAERLSVIAIERLYFGFTARPTARGTKVGVRVPNSRARNCTGA